ncbi:MAG: precorrin-2 C(20)-methyltransferase [Lachnospiraceae bacterium]|nr:precorrin-2 C(20)-methyltransferase [Lachnospiraceae bacterium]MDY5741704.1 precorrin-2 C(20)-methyltransferase [Lachnospiraceae bacterium]
MANKGILYGIGVGPGDPELLTLKAVRLLRESDVIAAVENAGSESVALRIALQAVPEIADKETIFLHTPMVKEQAVVQAAHRQGTERLAALLDQGKTIAFVTLGDATIYSTYLYYQKRLTKLGYRTRSISGIPSFCSIAAALGISLAENRESLVIHPATYQLQPAGDGLAEEEGDRKTDHKAVRQTIVYMKAGTKLKQIKDRHPDAELWMIENDGLPGERRFFGRDELPDKAGYYTVVIVKEGKRE